MRAASLSVTGVAAPREAQKLGPFASPVTWHQRDDGWVRIDWSQQPTAQQIADADAIVQAHDPAPPTLAVLSKQKFRIASNRELRAITVSAMRSDNVLRKFTRDLLTQIANATSLADLKTRCANNLPVLAALTADDAKNAIETEIDGPDAD